MRHWAAFLAGFLAILLGAANATPLRSQQRMEVDLENGRTVIGGPEYDFRGFAAVDRERRIVYVVDAVEPLGVMAISLDDGSQIAIYGGGEGEGPGELRTLRSVSVSPEGILVSGGGVVNHWSREGGLIGSWRPSMSEWSNFSAHCTLRGQPVVPAHDGAVRRTRDGSWEALGRRPGRSADPSLFMMSQAACVDDVAYVLDEDLTAYPLEGRARSLALPDELEAISRSWREGLRRGATGHPYSAMFGTGTGELVVVLPRFARGSVFGAVIDPETGCHTMLTAPDPVARERHVLLGMYRDSVVVGESYIDEMVIDGVRTPVIYDGTSAVSLRPLRPAGGTPCPEAR